MTELLFEYRYGIWIVGGLLALWLVAHLPTWQQVSQAGTWNAERDYARWRVRNGLLALVGLVSLLAATTAVVLL